MRLKDVLKELNIHIDDAKDYAKSLGFDIKSRNSKIDQPLYHEFVRKFGRDEQKENIIKTGGIKTDFLLKNSGSNLVNFEYVLNRFLIRIPDFQRGYSWTSKELNELWIDLSELSGSAFHFTGILSLEPINKTNRNVLIKEENLLSFLTEKNTLNFNQIDSQIEQESNEKTIDFYPVTIIDGQQRLTTLMILLCVLFEQIEKNKFNIDNQDLFSKDFLTIQNNGNKFYKFGYEKDIPSEQYFLSEIYRDEDIKVTEPVTIYTNNLLSAKKFFNKKLKESEINGENPRLKCIELLKKIQKQLLFNIMIIDSNQLDISMVFETLNYRGKPLSKLEILKNRLIYLVSKKYFEFDDLREKLRFEIVNTWQHVYSWIAKDNTINVNPDDAFLRDFWIMYFEHDKRPDHKFQFEEDLFNNKYRIGNAEDNSYINQDEVFTFLNYMKEAVEVWFYIKNPNDESALTFFKNKTVLNNVKRYSEMVKGSYINPLLMAVFIKQTTSSLVDILLTVERHNVILFYFNGKSSDTDRAEFYRLANKAFANRAEGRTIESMISFIEKRTRKHHKIDDFYSFIHESRSDNEQFYNWEGIEYVLSRFEESLNPDFDRFKRNIEKYRYFSGQNDSTFSDLLRSKRESQKKIYNSLGNIFLRQFTKNKKGEIKIFNLINENFKNDNDKWTFQLIKNRGLEILSFIESEYKLSLGNEQTKIKVLFDGVRDKD